MKNVLLSDEGTHLFHPKLFFDELVNKGIGKKVSYKATEQELQSLSVWAELHCVLAFEVEATPLVVTKNKVIEVHFNVKAHYMQDCVNTGKALDRQYEEAFDVTYFEPKLYKQQEEAYYQELSQGTISDFDFEELTGDYIDLGDIAGQYFVSSLEAHPKDVRMDLDEINAKYGGVGEEPHPDEKENPFDVLKELK